MFKREDAPKRDTKGKYDEAQAEEYRLARMNASVKGGTGIGNLNESRRKKIELECQKIQVEIDRLRGRLISREEFLADMVQLGSICKQHLEALPKEVAAVTRDPAVTKAVAAAVDKALAGMSAACGDAGAT